MHLLGFEPRLYRFLAYFLYRWDIDALLFYRLIWQDHSTYLTSLSGGRAAPSVCQQRASNGTRTHTNRHFRCLASTTWATEALLQCVLRDSNPRKLVCKTRCLNRLHKHANYCPPRLTSSLSDPACMSGLHKDVAATSK